MANIKSTTRETQTSAKALQNELRRQIADMGRTPNEPEPASTREVCNPLVSAMREHLLRRGITPNDPKEAA